MHIHIIYIYTYQYPLTPLAAEGARQRRNYQQQGQQGARRYYKQQGARSKIWQPCVSKLGGGQKKKTASFLVGAESDRALQAVAPRSVPSFTATRFEWLQRLQWSPHPQLLDVVSCSAAVAIVELWWSCGCTVV